MVNFFEEVFSELYGHVPENKKKSCWKKMRTLFEEFNKVRSQRISVPGKGPSSVFLKSIKPVFIKQWKLRKQITFIFFQYLFKDAKEFYDKYGAEIDGKSDDDDKTDKDEEEIPTTDVVIRFIRILSERTNYTEEEKARFFQIAMLPYCAMKTSAYFTLLGDLNDPKMSSLIQEVPGDVLLPSLSLPLEEQREIFYRKKGNIEEIIKGVVDSKSEEPSADVATADQKEPIPDETPSGNDQPAPEVPSDPVDQPEQTSADETNESVVEEEIPQQEEIPNCIPSLEPMENRDEVSEELKGIIFNSDQTFTEFGPFYDNSKIPPFNRKDVITGYLKVQNNYFNFYPLYSWQDGEPVKIENIQELYPEMGNILLTNDTGTRFTNRILRNGGLYNMQIEREDLLPTSQFFTGNLSHYAVNLTKLIRENRFIPAFEDVTDDGYRRAYTVVQPKVPEQSLENSDKVEVWIPTEGKNQDPIIDLLSPVLLEYHGAFYGPYHINKNQVGSAFIKLSSPLKMENIEMPAGLVTRFSPRGQIFKTGNMWFLPYLNACRFAFVGPRFVTRDVIDVISDDELIQNFMKVLPNAAELFSGIRAWLENHRNQGGNIDLREEWSKDRAQRLEVLLSCAFKEMKQWDYLENVVSKLVLNSLDKAPKAVEELLNRLAARRDVLIKLPNTKAVTFEILRLEQQKKTLTNDLNTFKTECDKTKKDYREKIADLQKKIKTLDGIQNLDEQKNALETKVKELKQEKQNREDELEKLKLSRQAFEDQMDHFNDKLQNTVETVAGLSFEGAITAKIMEAASNWNNQNTDALYEKRIAVLKSIPKVESERETLNRELVRRFSMFRHYDSNDYVNFFVCVAQSFLTVLSGPPGCGKTSFSDIFGRIMGLTNINQSQDVRSSWGKTHDLANRYLPISVERGWSSKRDLIGYFNPLTRKFESPDPHRYECFIQLDKEARHKFSDLPYVLLLDEANLSPMEYYFADFMNVCDERNELSHISLGGDLKFRIPDNLRFIATINNDHTVEQLSPRLIDRAFIVTLPNFSIGDEVNTENIDNTIFKPVEWKAFIHTYGGRQVKLTPSMNQALKDLAEASRNLGIDISPRTYNAMVSYLAVASKYLESRDGVNAEAVALDFVVLQKILPAINGFDDDYQKQIEAFKAFASEKGYLRSVHKLERILNKGAVRGLFSFF